MKVRMGNDELVVTMSTTLSSEAVKFRMSLADGRAIYTTMTPEATRALAAVLTLMAKEAE